MIWLTRWRVLPIDFTQETGELTPSLKLKRKVVTERYGRWVEEMYASDEDTGAVTDRAIETAQSRPVAGEPATNAAPA